MLFRRFSPVSLCIRFLVTALYATIFCSVSLAETPKNLPVKANAELPVWKAGGKISFAYGEGSENSLYQGALLKSGYLWTLLDKDSDAGVFSLHIGAALQPYTEDNARREAILLNEFSVAFRAGDFLLKTGRTLSAAGALHNDLEDTGTPGVGSDNQPVSFWNGGNFSANTGQKLTAPFAPRTSVFYYPFKKTEIGVSYAPRIDDYGRDDTALRARGADCGFDPLAKNNGAFRRRPIFTQFSESAACDEVSLGVKQAGILLDKPFGVSAGVTRAKSQKKGDIEAVQLSAYLQVPKKGFFGADRKYQIVFGQMSGRNLFVPTGDAEILEDQRAGFQISDRYEKLTVSYAFQSRRVDEVFFTQGKDGRRRSSLDQEWNNGFQYEITPGLLIGTEYSVRTDEERREGFLWSFGGALVF